MNRVAIVFIVVLVLSCVLSGCSNDTGDVFSNKPDSTAPTTTVQPTGTQNPGIIANGNKESAFTDATSAVSLFMSYMVGDGTTGIDNGVVFSVEKSGTVYDFEYQDGELVDAQSLVHGDEVTPQDETWPSNVKVYLP